MKWVDSIAFALVGWALISCMIEITPTRYYQAKERKDRERQDAVTAALVEHAREEIEARGAVN